jgi:DnaJ like chaperone protein
MGIIGSILGATVGWWMAGGPIGAIIGLVLGHVAQEASSVNAVLNEQDHSRQAPGGFLASLLVLMAAVMKADGKVVHAELDYAKQHLIRTLGPQKAADALILLRDLLKQPIPLKEVCLQVRVNLDYASRLELVHFLLGLARADGHFAGPEKNIIQQIAYELGISADDIGSLQGMFGDDIKSAYQILEISPEASNDEIKKAYRQLAIRFHPDKVEHLGEDFKKSAHAKFQKLNDAYEKVKKERGIK